MLSGAVSREGTSQLHPAPVWWFAQRHRYERGAVGVLFLRQTRLRPSNKLGTRRKLA